MKPRFRVCTGFKCVCVVFCNALLVSHRPDWRLWASRFLRSTATLATTAAAALVAAALAAASLSEPAIATIATRGSWCGYGHTIHCAVDHDC